VVVVAEYGVEAEGWVVGDAVDGGDDDGGVPEGAGFGGFLRRVERCEFR